MSEIDDIQEYLKKVRAEREQSFKKLRDSKSKSEWDALIKKLEEQFKEKENNDE